MGMFTDPPYCQKHKRYFEEDRWCPECTERQYVLFWQVIPGEPMTFCLMKRHPDLEKVRAVAGALRKNVPDAKLFLFLEIGT